MRIVIDAGHGPDTAGKRTPDGSLREYQFNSAVALLVGALLFDYEGVEVLMVHEDGRDVPLQERTNKANAWGADLYVSIHANANGSGSWDSANGIENYVYTTRPPAAVALALAVQRQLIRRTGLLDRGVKSADFHVLRETKMPAILVECGFMTNRQEAELLKKDIFRQSCAAAIVAGIAETYGLVAKAKEEGVENIPQLPQDIAANIISSYLKKAWADCETERIRAEQEGRAADAEAWRGLRDWQHHLANELRAASGLPADA